ncbi:MAG TPA: DUF5996 family protein [Oceanobacillus sp.]|nr:DUF5996 family protein [Oceanobacillus sp.]
MRLPLLSGWESTRDDLHRAAQVIGALKKTIVPQQVNALHLSLFVYSKGLTTGKLPEGGELALNFIDQCAEYHSAEGATETITLAGSNPATLASTLVEFTANEQTDTLPLPSDSTSPFQIDPTAAADYARTLYTVYTALARFRARLLGTMTPLVVWPHGFDLSFLWFHGNDLDEHSQPHLNFGFSPGSPGFPRPYLYAYAYPSPDDLTSRTLPSPARWFTESWKGAVVDYDNLTDDDPENQIETLARSIYATLL